MKKVFGFIFIAIAVLNVVGFIYLISTNPDKLSDNSEYFFKKILLALVFGGIGIYLVLSNQKKDITDHQKDYSQIDK